MVPGSSECFSFLSETGSKDFKSDDERGGIGGRGEGIGVMVISEYARRHHKENKECW